MNFRNLPLSAILLALPLAASGASSGSGTTVAEVLSTKQSVPPTVMFVVDLSSNMDTDCFGSGNTCLADTVDVIKQVALHFPDAKYGVVGTMPGDASDTMYPVAPIGSTYSEISAALAALTTNGSTTRNLAEVIEALGETYYDLPDPDSDGVDSDSDGFTGDWGETPIAHDCSISHIIVLASGRPMGDDGGSDTYASGPAVADVRCDEFGVVDGSTINADIECHFDNAVGHMFYWDYQSTLSGVQRVVVSAIGLGLDGGDADEATALSLFASAGDNTEQYGMYSNATSKSEAISAVLAVTEDIMAGVYSRSTPVISGDGAWLTYSYYELTGNSPLAKGHILGYQIDNDPTSSSYGQLNYVDDDLYYGALWDGGWLLNSRVADTKQTNDDDQNGDGERDIYFFDSTFQTVMSDDYDLGRMSFDKDFVDAVSTTGVLTDILAETTTTTLVIPALPSLPYICQVPDDLAYDLDRSGCQDLQDLQTLVDFTRGVADTQFRYLDVARGQWKLQDSPYSVPAVITKTNSMYSNSMTYRRFLQLLTDEMMPDIALMAANDGMLHAFALSDDETTLDFNEAGEELWAWIPTSLIWRDRGATWAGGLVDAMWYGRTYLFDGSPVVEDVWIDLNGNSKKDCSDSDDLDTCEWRRVVVVQQGLGGTRTIALDITYTHEPKFLWEVTNDDPGGMGMTTGRPVVFNVYDRTVPDTVTDRWVALWPGGRPANYDDATTDYTTSTEGSLYMWGMGDDVFTGGAPNVNYSVQGDNITEAEHPDTVYSDDLDSDSDGNLEYTYIAAPPSVVDVDSDGDGDVAYFPVSIAYDPDDGPDKTKKSSNSGSTWIYKAIINETSPSDLTWCKFYDPVEGAPSSSGGATVPFASRPEVYYSLTTAWLGNQGALGVYWGTGSPFSNSTTTQGAMFFMRDDNPENCATEAQAITCDGNDGGFYSLALGERLTSDPIVYAGIVYFATYTPDSDACEVGTGRLYGMDYEDCSKGLDTNGDGALDDDDDVSIESEGYISNVSIGDNGKIYYSGATDVDVQILDAAQDPFNGTALVGWMEMF